MHDVAIVGAGIVGCSVAFSLLEERPQLDVVLLEKEPTIGRHQSGRNSGILQPGYALEPGSDAAAVRNAGTREGRKFCERHDVPVQTGGSVTVARTDEDIGRLRDLAENAAANDVLVDWLDVDELLAREPYVAGVAGLAIQDEVAIDSRGFLEAIAAECRSRGAKLRPGWEVTGVRRLAQNGKPYQLQIAQAEDTAHAGDVTPSPVETTVVVNCAGINAVPLARRFGVATDVRVIPFRATYYELVPGQSYLCQSIIHPVSDLSSRSPGVKLIRRPDGTVLLGPTIRPSLGYETYTRRFDPRDLPRLFSAIRKWNVLSDKSIWGTAAIELKRSVSRRAFAKAASRIVPSLSAANLRRSFVGIAPQLVVGGSLANPSKDIRVQDRSIHVLDPLSAGVTVALPLGRELAEGVLDELPG